MSSTLLEYLRWAAPILGAVVGWFAGRYGRRSDSLMKMQETIDMLVAKNQELTRQITELRQENSSLKQEQLTLKAQLDSLSDTHSSKKRKPVNK